MLKLIPEEWEGQGEGHVRGRGTSTQEAHVQGEILDPPKAKGHQQETSHIPS